VNMSVKWMKREGATGAKHGWDTRVLYETDYNNKQTVYCRFKIIYNDRVVWLNG